MKKKEFTWEWDEKNKTCKIISKILPAVITSSNGKKTFFNQILAAYLGWVDKRNKYGHSVTFADNSLLPDETIKDIS